MAPGDRVALKGISQGLLALLTLFALVDSIGAGAFIAPFLLPLLWLAIAHSVRPWLIPLWVLLTFGCSWITGAMLAYLATPSLIEPVSLSVAALLTAVLAVTALRYGRHTAQESV